MTNRELALKFLEFFCAADIDGLGPLLSSDLTFRGPFHTFYSSDDYLNSLKKDPPEISRHKILSITEDDNSGTVAIFYEYQKSDSTIQIAQLFAISDQRITNILLIFDSLGFV